MCAFPPFELSEKSDFVSSRCVTALPPPPRAALHGTGEGVSCPEPCCPAAGSWSRRAARVYLGCIEVLLDVKSGREDPLVIIEQRPASRSETRCSDRGRSSPG